jgi:hypothetical protein
MQSNDAWMAVVWKLMCGNAIGCCLNGGDLEVVVKWCDEKMLDWRWSGNCCKMMQWDDVWMVLIWKLLWNEAMWWCLNGGDLEVMMRWMDVGWMVVLWKCIWVNGRRQWLNGSSVAVVLMSWNGIMYEWWWSRSGYVVIGWEDAWIGKVLKLLFGDGMIWWLNIGLL